MNVGMAILYVVLLIIGFVLLVKGADFFVDGAAGIAKKLKVSSFIIGVTVVALGTSAPEMAVTVIGAIGGESGIIVGNITGSNILNIFLILGVSAVICKLPVEKSTRVIDLPFLIVISALFVIFGFFGGTFAWWEGLILLLLYCVFMGYTVMLATKQKKAQLEQATAVSITDADDGGEIQSPTGFFEKIKFEYERLQNKVWFLIVITVVGLGMVVGGAQLVVTSAKYIAETVFKIPTEIVALTVVAFGTSLPEFVTSVSAARKGDVGIATGNIIGSNIANILLIGGLGVVCCGSSGLLFTTEGFISGLVALFASVLIFASCWGKSKSIGRIAGIIMLLCLVAYYVFIFLNFYIFNLY